MKIAKYFIHPLRLLFYFVGEECQFRNDARLISYPVAKRPPDFTFVYIELFQKRFLILVEHHADIDFRETKIRAHAHIHHRYECAWEEAALITLKDITQFLLNESRKLLLPHGSTHGSKVKRKMTLWFVESSLVICAKTKRVLRYFRINDPYRLIGIFLLLLLSGGWLLFDPAALMLEELHGMVVGEEVMRKMLYVELIDGTAPLMAMLDGVMNFLFGRSLAARHMVAFLLIFFQAVYFGVILINNRAYNESTYVPAVILAMLALFSFDLIALTPELAGAVFLLPAVNKLFREIAFNVEDDAIVLNLGVYIGLASLFHFPYTIFLLGIILMMVVYARAGMRKILLVLFGYGLVHLILITIYYINDEAGDLWTNFYRAPFAGTSGVGVSFRSLLYLMAFPLLYLVFSWVMLTREARFTKYQSQLLQVMFLWMLTGILQVSLAPNLTPHGLLVFIPPMAYFIAHYLLLIRRKWIAELMLWIFMLGILTVSYAARYGKLAEVNYDGLFAKSSSVNLSDKKVMLIGDDPGLYLHNKLGGYFLDWRLSQKYFLELDSYSNITRIHQSIRTDAPDVIVDELNLMPAIIARIPALEIQYRREGEIYIKN